LARLQAPGAATLCSLLAWVALTGCGTDGGTSASHVRTAPPTAAQADLSTYRSTRSHDATAAPVRVRIPSIGVDSGLEELVREDDQSIAVPEDPDSAGWWAGGPRPGQVGPAVILGHLDSRTGPAVFYRLGELTAGDEVLVDRADGSTARFLVTSTQRYAKAKFPSELVYYPTLRPELRLVTCGGPRDPTGRSLDNVVLFAEQA
jgi:sortase (surface protein transpeptidase)